MKRALILLLLASCGGSSTPRAPTIEDLRQRARERPNDPEAQYALAEAELLMRGGDANAAAAQIDRAAALRPNDIRLTYLRAQERKLHGHPREALDHYLQVISLARTSDDPIAPSLAEISAAEIEDLDDNAPGYVERVSEVLAPIHAEPGGIGDAARNTIGSILIDVGYRRADLDRVRALTDAQRCITSWRVAGPFGPRQLLGFDTRLAPDADETLGERYEYGPGRGQRETREVNGRGCTVHVGGGPVGGGGTTYAEGTLEVPSGGRWVIRLETPNAVELFIDGQSAVRLDRRREPLPRVTYHEVELAAGAHRVRAKIASRHPNPVLELSASQTAGPPGGAEIEGETLVADFARVQRALGRGDVVTARERVRAHVHEDGSPLFLIAGAWATLNDPLRSGQVRHDSARRLLAWTADRDENAWYPSLTLAQLDANEGRETEAMSQLREALQRWPELVGFALQLIDWYEQRGWHRQADDAIARAREIAPDACRPLRTAMNQARRRQRAADELSMAEALVRCDARSDALMSTYIRRRDWERASAELTRLAALEPAPTPVSALSARLGIAQARGDDEEAARVIAELGRRMPQATGPVMMEVDRTLARDQAQPARQRIEAALSAEPESMMEMRRMLRAIGGASPLESYRLDGAEIIRGFESSGRRYDEPMVLVLDYTVYRVFDDGSMLELTHNIFRLNTQEAIDQMGEYNVPENAQMLTIQTVKADGRRLEPDEIAGKDTLSFPSLAPGDYIEFEYMRPRGAPLGYPGGFIGDRFYFQNFETPFDRSQLTVVTPDRIELMLDPRGPAPQTVMQREDGLRVYSWRVDESRPLVEEPGSVVSREFIPSIYWGYGASWAMYIESLRDVLADRDIRDPAAERVVRDILGEEGDRATPEQRARRIYAWVLDNIEDPGEGAFDLAPAMLAARSGNRSRVLAYLLGVAGLEAEVALVRSYAADSNEAELPDEDTYQSLAVRLSGLGEPIWLHAGSRGAPFGYMPPVLSGMPALMLTPGGETVRLPERAADADLRTVELDVEINESGGGRVSVVETYRGAGAVLWRDQLEGIPEADLESQFESQYVASFLPGGRLSRLAITGRETPEEPLVLRYEAEVESLVRRTRAGLGLPPLYRVRLGQQYAPVESRTTTQLVMNGTTIDVTMRVSAPDGMTVATEGSTATIDGPNGARVGIANEREGAALVVRRSYRVPRMRVPPDQYPELARFARSADEAESAEITIQR